MKTINESLCIKWSVELFSLINCRNTLIRGDFGGWRGPRCFQDWLEMKISLNFLFLAVFLALFLASFFAGLLAVFLAVYIAVFLAVPSCVHSCVPSCS